MYAARENWVWSSYLSSCRSGSRSSCSLRRAIEHPLSPQGFQVISLNTRHDTGRRYPSPRVETEGEPVTVETSVVTPSQVDQLFYGLISKSSGRGCITRPTSSVNIISPLLLMCWGSGTAPRAWSSRVCRLRDTPRLSRVDVEKLLALLTQGTNLRRPFQKGK